MDSEEIYWAHPDMNDSSALPPRADVYLLTGFLGSGKTTLLRNMLRWETDLSGTVVLVNEFGKVGIDGDILRKSGSDVVELTSGCVCCTLKGELVQALKDISARFRPRRIIIEATGVAQPESMTATLDSSEITDPMNLKRTDHRPGHQVMARTGCPGGFFLDAAAASQAHFVEQDRSRGTPRRLSGACGSPRWFPGCADYSRAVLPGRPGSVVVRSPG